MTQARSPAVLLIVREPIQPGQEVAYRAIEDETARDCGELGCPHPHLALQPVTGEPEVWWINAFASEADMRRVEQAYAGNDALMAALNRNSARKAPLTGPMETVPVRHRPDLGRAAGWSWTGARFLVLGTTRDASGMDAHVFEAADGVLHLLVTASTRAQADAAAQRLGGSARVLAIRPRWGLPARQWVDADPEFWTINPNAGRSQFGIRSG